MTTLSDMNTAQTNTRTLRTEKRTNEYYEISNPQNNHENLPLMTAQDSKTVTYLCDECMILKFIQLFSQY